MEMKRICAACTALLIFYVMFLDVACTAADEVILLNGDRLTGTIGEMTSEILTLTTSYSDPIRITKEKIRIIHTDGPVEIHLSGGEVLRGRAVTDEDGRMQIEASTDREKSSADWKAVVAINPKKTDPVRLKGSITIGGNLQTGNTKRSSAAVHAEGTRRTITDRIGLRLQFNYARDENSTTVRNSYGALKYDYFFTKSLFGYLGLELLKDSFKNLSLRTIAGPGAGCQIWDEPAKSLLLEAGLSYVSENLREGDDEQYVTARLAGSLDLKILSWMVFSDRFILHPSLENVGEYKLRNEAALTSPLAAGWSLSLKNIVEMNSQPPEGVGKTDLSWMLGMQYNF